MVWLGPHDQQRDCPGSIKTRFGFVAEKVGYAADLLADFRKDLGCALGALPQIAEHEHEKFLDS